MPAKVVKTSARFIRTAPDKIRNLAGLVKGQTIEKALAQVMFSGKAAATPLTMVLKQARAQIKDQNLIEDNFKVAEMRVDEGPKLKRRRICHQGRSTAILKRMSHLTIILNEKITVVKENKPKLVKKEEV
ncbi:MAG: 50S ribosomal protein L22 [Candidatus Berkelbacteria bacterium]